MNKATKKSRKAVAILVTSAPMFGGRIVITSIGIRGAYLDLRDGIACTGLTVRVTKIRGTDQARIILEGKP